MVKLSVYQCVSVRRNFTLTKLSGCLNYRVAAALGIHMKHKHLDIQPVGTSKNKHYMNKYIY